MKLTIDQLERCVALVLRRAREQGVVEIDTGDRDLYWTALGSAWMDFQSAPDLAVGSLDDDLEQLAAVLDEPSRLSGNEFDRVAAAIRFVGLVVGGE